MEPALFLRCDMDYIAQVYLLSQKFIQDYPLAVYSELLYKPGRPYACLLIETHEGYLICVPFRSNIQHKNAFLFKNTLRSLNSQSGLDYSKMVLIQNKDYLDLSKTAVVDQDEYNEMRANLPKIVGQVYRYIGTYMDHVTGVKPLHPQGYARKYGFSTLPYFHDVMGI